MWRILDTAQLDIAELELENTILLLLLLKAGEELYPSISPEHVVYESMEMWPKCGWSSTYSKSSLVYRQHFRVQKSANTPTVHSHDVDDSTSLKELAAQFRNKCAIKKQKRKE